MTKQELTIWIERYGRDIYSFCRHLTGNAAAADELYQDTWLKVMERLQTIDNEGNVKSYCLAVAVGLWRNQRRKWAWRNRIAPMRAYEEKDADLAAEKTSPEEQLVAEQTRQQVWKAVNALPQKLRLIVLLYYMEKQTVSQIAGVLGIPEGTVKSRLYQARKILAEELGDLYA